eukprot:416895_1
MSEVKETETNMSQHIRGVSSMRSIKYYSCINCEVYCTVNKIENCECLNEQLYTLCEKCNAYIHEFKIDEDLEQQKPSEEIRDSLYFVIHNNDVGGPYTSKEIVKLYVCRKFTENQIQIMPASKQDSWCQVTLPNSIMPNIIDHECILCKIKELNNENIVESINTDQTQIIKVLNNESEGVYKYLYKRLIIDVLKGDLKQIIIPKQEPKYNHTFLWFLGVIIVTIFTITISLHTIPSLLIAIIMIKIFMWMRDCCGCVDDIFFYHHDSVQNFILFTAYSGIIILPILICETILSNMDYKWDEYQSWMIAYIFWGVASFVTSLSYFYAEIKRSQRKIYQAVSWFIFLVIGLDFGEIDIFDAFATSHVDIIKLIFKDSFKQKMIQITILFLFPSLFSLLPALVVGF